MDIFSFSMLILREKDKLYNFIPIFTKNLIMEQTIGGVIGRKYVTFPEIGGSSAI